jgi:UDP-glucose 4-epimerase
MKALITGGCGFIGSHLAEKLINSGHSVVIVDNLVSGRLENISKIAAHKNISFFQADIRDIKKIESLFADVDWVFHLAGLADIVPSIERPHDYFLTNVTGTFNVLESSRKFNVKRFIYAASSSSYGIPNQFPTSELSLIDPQYPYALTKYMGEELVMHWSKVYSVPSISLRLFNVFGPRSRTSGTYGAVFGVFLAQKLSGKPYTVVGDGKQSRDFTYVSDVVDAFVNAATSSIHSEFMNVGSGNHYPINKLVELLGGEVVYLPKRPGEPDCTFADISKIKKLLGWQPKITFEEGVTRMLENISYWKDAPVWDASSIEEATKIWFNHLGNK